MQNHSCRLLLAALLAAAAYGCSGEVGRSSERKAGTTASATTSDSTAAGASASGSGSGAIVGSDADPSSALELCDTLGKILTLHGVAGADDIVRAVKQKISGAANGTGLRLTNDLQSQLKQVVTVFVAEMSKHPEIKNIIEEITAVLNVASGYIANATGVTDPKFVEDVLTGARTLPDNKVLPDWLPQLLVGTAPVTTSPIDTTINCTPGLTGGDTYRPLTEGQTMTANYIAANSPVKAPCSSTVTQQTGPQSPSPSPTGTRVVVTSVQVDAVPDYPGYNCSDPAMAARCACFKSLGISAVTEATATDVVVRTVYGCRNAGNGVFKALECAARIGCGLAAIAEGAIEAGKGTITSDGQACQDPDVPGLCKASCVEQACTTADGRGSGTWHQAAGGCSCTR